MDKFLEGAMMGMVIMTVGNAIMFCVSRVLIAATPQVIMDALHNIFPAIWVLIIFGIPGGILGLWLSVKLGKHILEID